jgi:L,D-transpeptidase catalytic domain
MVDSVSVRHYQHLKQARALCLSIFILLIVGVTALADQDGSQDEQVSSESAHEDNASVFNKLRYVTKNAPIKRSIFRRSATFGKVARGAILALRPMIKTKKCPGGWFERKSGGFVCGEFLKRTRELSARPAHRDRPDVLKGTEAYKVIGKGAKYYYRLADIDRDHPLIRLHYGSMLIIKEKVSRGGKQYLKTRQGWYVEAQNTQRLPSIVKSLGVDGGDFGGMIIDDNVPVYETADDAAAVTRHLARWSVVHLNEESKTLIANDGWVELPDDGFVRDKRIARLRHAPKPKKLKDDEHWIAIDINEQLLLAYEGQKLVRIVPCSTGLRGNTRPGRYHIQWKRRRQSMRLRHGHIRVEDVQWVMYYHRRNGIAIHSAYWHDGFGRPLSHGCVNLPSDDARWLFEWATPKMMVDDSERFPVTGEPGSKVVVFSGPDHRLRT